MNKLKKLSPALATILIVGVTFVLIFLMLAATISPERYDLRAGGVSPITITATKDVEDKLTTQRLAEAAARLVQPSYISDATVQPEVLSALQEDFSQLLSYRARTAPLGADEELGEGARLEALGAMPPVDVSDEALLALARMDDATLSALYERTFALVRETLSAKLPEGQEEEAIQKVARDLLSDGYTEAEADVAVALVRHTLKPNMLLDEVTTEQNRQKEMEKVEPIVYKKGQNIVRGGELVTESQIAMLEELGMLKDKSVDMTLFLGLGLILALCLIILVGFMRVFTRPLLSDTRRLTLLAMIIVVTAALSMTARAFSPFLMPVALAAMLTTLLIDAHLALVVNVVMSVIAGLLTSMDSGAFTSSMFSVMLTSIISGSLCVPLIKRRPQIKSVVLAGLAVGLANMISTFSVGLIGSASQVDVFAGALWAGGGGLFATAMCILFDLAFEWLFNLVTPSKLMELANPNRPLLRRLLIEAPGTYHHSILVANLAEAAANEVGANGLLTRVGSYYHDIGKLKRPLYFKENQLNDNPHDRTDPRVSTAILTAHPRDGVEMGQKARLPEAVLEIIAQHHGDTPVLFFYDKAIKQGGDVDLSSFRYDGPRPRSREAAIVMLADTVEAAARAVTDQPSPDKMNQLIRRLVRSKMEDGQLDECPLTFADLSKICDAFSTVLSGIYHERVEYPNIAPPERVPAEPKAEPLTGEPAVPEPKPAVPEPKPAAPEPKPAAPEPKPAVPEPKPVAPEPSPVEPEQPKEPEDSDADRTDD